MQTIVLVVIFIGLFFFVPGQLGRKWSKDAKNGFYMGMFAAIVTTICSHILNAMIPLW